MIAEASVNSEASGDIRLELSVALSIFAAMFVAINLINAYVFKPIFAEIEKVSVKFDERSEDEIKELNSDGQAKYARTLVALKSKLRYALITISVYNLIAFSIWYIIIGCFLYGNKIFAVHFFWTLIVSAASTIIALSILVLILIFENLNCATIEETKKIGKGKELKPGKRATRKSGMKA